LSKIEVNTIEPQCGTTLTLGASGDTVTLGSGASQSGFGRTGTVDWDTTPKTANFDAVSGDGFFCNTTSSAFTATLPSGAAGAIVSFADYAGTWQTNNLTVSPQSGEKIGGTSANVVLSTEGQSVTFVYVDSTQGWVNVQDSTSNERGNPYLVATGGTISTCGNYKIHTFTGPGTFTVCRVAVCSADNNVEYVVVAGGGSGAAKGPGDAGGGGGAGGFRFATPSLAPLTFPGKPLNAPAGVPVTATGFPITVGAGGSGASAPGGGCAPDCNGANGNPSTFSTITSTGGGRGGYNTNRSNATGFPGGSGGGAGAGIGPGSPTAGGSGNTPPVSPAQGTNGGPYQYASPNRQGAGGGGAIVSGGTGSCSGSKGGGDGAGLPTGFGANGESCGSFRYYAGGGAGGSGEPPTALGGKGGGGNGANPASDPEGNGVANTGGGGGGGSGHPVAVAGGSGGSGIVIIRYRYQ
jgi:hypothetical protein